MHNSVSRAVPGQSCNHPADRNRVKVGPDGTMLRLRLFGQMRAEDARGHSVLPRTRKTRAVLAIIALSSPQPVLRLQLTNLLWSQREKEQARASLRQSIHELQDALPHTATPLFTAERHHLVMHRAGIWIDVLHATQPDVLTPDLLDGFRAPLLDDLVGIDPAFDQWLRTERSRLLMVARAMGERMMADDPSLDGRRHIADQLLALDPLNETVWRALMRDLHEMGDRSGALAAYDRCKTALTTAGCVAVSPETEELALRIRGQSQAARDQASDEPAAPPATTATADGGEMETRPGVRLGIKPLRAIGAAESEELSLGLAEEVTTSLSRFRWISCISAASWNALTESPLQDATWASLDLDFVLDGTIQRTTDRVRITVRLMDMRIGGAVIWAHRFDRQATDALSLQDEIGSAIVAQLDPALLIHEGERAAARPTRNPSTREKVLRALPPVYRLERQGFHEAGRLLESAVSGDPANAVAHAWLAYWHLFLVGQGWSASPRVAAERAAELAERAVTLDPTDARALTLAGHVRSFLAKRPAEGSALHDRAIALNPNLALAWCFSGLAHCYLGNHDEALRRMFQAVRLSPSDPHLFFFDHAMIMPHLLLAEYDSAAEIGRRASELNPWFSSAYKGYLAALGYLGRERETDMVLTRLLELEPSFSVEEAVERSPMTRPEDVARYAEGLRRAGLPERRNSRAGERLGEAH